MLEMKNSDTETNLLMLLSIWMLDLSGKAMNRRILSCCLVSISKIKIVFVCSADNILSSFYQMR